MEGIDEKSIFFRFVFVYTVRRVSGAGSSKGLQPDASTFGPMSFSPKMKVL